MSPLRLLGRCLILVTASAFAADAIPSVSTYKKEYGPSKAPLSIDPAKDLPRYPAVAPKDAVATWQVKKGFKMELAASEPQVRSPVAISFDERGRMFVCEMIDYSEMRDVTPHLGRISMLEDNDGDGVYETSTVFADNLPWPTGLICANGGLYVIATPDIYFFKDTKGTGHADVREVVFTGFGTGLKMLNVQGLANCPQWGFDNRIHIQAGGGNRGKVKCLKRPDLPEVELGGRDFWFDPRTYDFGLEAGGAQYGMGYDNYGRKFACSNSDHLQYFVYDDHYAARNPYFSMPPARQSIAADGGAAEVYRISPDEPWRIIRTRWRIAGVVKGMVEGGGRVSGYFTGATGTMIYRGDAYGESFLNNAFCGDAGGQLVHRKIIYPDGVSLIGRRPADEQRIEFAASRDTWVRPVDFSNAPDGCLHVIDMYREVIEHPWSIPDEIKKHLDLNSGNDRGRIYRIVPDRADWKRRNTVTLDKADTAELVKTLEHPNGWHRDTAMRLLYERQDKAAVPLLEKMAGSSPNPLGRLHALCVLDGLGSLTEEMVDKALDDKDPHVVEQAVKFTEKLSARGALGSAEIAKLVQLSTRQEPHLRFQVLLTLGGLASTGADANAVLVVRALAHALVDAAASTDTKSATWLAAAVASANADLAAPVLSASFKALGKPSPEADRLLAPLVKTVGARDVPAEISATIALLTSGDAAPSPELLRAFSEGLKRTGKTIASVDTDKKLAGLFAKAAATARDAKAGDTPRLAAISLLEIAPFKNASSALTACLGQGQPEPIQNAAIRVLGQTSAKEATATLLDNWKHYGPQSRQTAMEVMFARPERTIALLEAVQKGGDSVPLKAADLSPSQVQNLIKHRDPKVAELAKTALASVIPPSRASVMAKYQPALTLKGDATRGQTVYSQRCIACHRANNLGVQVGPDLITVKTKGREGIFVAILDPNKEVAPQYIAYTVETKDGQTMTGVITNDSANSVTLKIMGGVELNFPRANIKGMHASGASLMPEGIEAGMTTQDLADVLDFIESLK